MPKSGDLKLFQEVTTTNGEAPKVLTVHDELDTDGNTVLRVDNPDVLDIEYMGIPLAFELTLFDVMKARALAFGVTLERRYS